MTGGGWGVFGRSNTHGTGVVGVSDTGVGVEGGTLTTGTGVSGRSVNGRGVSGFSNHDDGVVGFSESGSSGVRGISGTFFATGSGTGVAGQSGSGHGVVGESNSGNGVRGFSDGGSGVVGVCNGTGTALWGISTKGAGVDAESFGWHALYARAWDEKFASGYFDGNVIVTGNLQKGGGGFKIDHPLDPANKYLSHSFVESPDMKNVYDGVVTLDDNCEAEIELPDWFSSLNKDFRYQLTAIGSPAPNLHISKQISGRTRNKKGNSSSFKIAGGTSDMKVSWQVTGIRKDAWANAHRIKAEEDKSSKERGFYINPELYGKPQKKGISQLLFPEEKRKLLISERKLPKLKPIKLKKFVLPTVRK